MGLFKGLFRKPARWVLFQTLGRKRGEKELEKIEPLIEAAEEAAGGKFEEELVKRVENYNISKMMNF